MKNALKDVIWEMLNSPDPTSSILLWKLNNEIESILVEQFGSYLNPDVSALANKFNIEVFDDSIIEDFTFFNRHNTISIPVANYQIFFDVFSNVYRKEIRVDKNVPPSTKRYAIAYGIAEILMVDDGVESYESYTLMEVFHSSKKDIIKDSFALLLLFSVHSTIEILEKFYCSSCQFAKKEKTSEDWIRFFARSTNSSQYYATKAYQITRNLLGMVDSINDKELLQLREKIVNIFTN